jgi:pimeloyl-ACP methyl ester carboxylesterase
MKPIAFGNSSRPLFGVLHPAIGRPSDVGIVLVQPGVHEYERAHWAFRSLASALAARGRHVLRFDYRGMGDSAGDPSETTFEACVEDARTACAEMREVPGVRRVSLVGMRLGAAIATTACATRAPSGGEGVSAEHLVLWEPVVRGAKYLADMETLDASMRLRLLHSPRRPRDELAGFAFPAPVRASIARVDLAMLGAVAARRVLVLASAGDDEVSRLTEALRGGGSSVVVNATSKGDAIAKASARQSAVIPGTAVAEIATQIEASFA